MQSLIIQFIVGSVILLFSTHLLVKLAERISSAAKISPLIVGMTVVALGTSLPELAFSVTALTQSDPGLAMGNIVGSNIVNILLVLPVGILIGKLRIGTTKTQRNAAFLLVATAGFIFLQFSQYNNKVIGAVFILAALVVTILEYLLGLQGQKNEDKKMFKYKRKTPLGIIAILGAPILVAGIAGGSYLAVGSVEGIALATGISTTILGLSLTAVVTSLPELLTTIFSQEEHDGKLTIGNILGSNLYNLLLIGGIITLVSGRNGLPVINWVILGVTTIIFIVMIGNYKGRNVPRVWGFSYLLLLAIYLFTLSY